MYLLIHHARAAGSRTEASGAGCAACQRIVVSTITYADICSCAADLKALPRLIQLFVRLSAILPWDHAAVDAATDIKVALPRRDADRPE